MRVAALVHFYVPFRAAGSETMLHTLMRALAEVGHETKVIATDIPEAPSRYRYEDVSVATSTRQDANRILDEFGPDVVITHHDNTEQSIKYARNRSVPSVYLMHNDMAPGKHGLSLSPSLVVFNTHWMARKFSGYSLPSTTLHPPVRPELHRTTPGSHVTQVNLNVDKGAERFYALAERMPDIPFLGVIGGHGEQIRRELPNVELVEPTDDMARDVWSRTGVLLMPSIYESYGMVGVEALASGIPVIAHPATGLLESLSYAGSFADRDDLDGWQRTIESLQQPDVWQAASTLARARSAELDAADDLDRWVHEVERLVTP